MTPERSQGGCSATRTAALSMKTTSVTGSFIGCSPRRDCGGYASMTFDTFATLLIAQGESLAYIRTNWVMPPFN